MTVYDATHKLFEFFTNKHVFCMNKHFKDVVPISEEEEVEKATLNLALEDMAKNEILKQTKIEGDEYYILARPMESFEQSVPLNYTTAFMVAHALNEFCEAIGDYTDAAEVGNISEKDIKNLVILNEHHKTQMTKLMQKESGSFGDNINFDNL
jgi:hypothetical protein